MNDSMLLVERDGEIVSVTINRPQKRNALSKQVILELTDVFGSLVAGGVLQTRAVILTGAGDRAFVAGADIAELSALTPLQAREFSDAGGRLATLMESAPFVVIAAVNGYALGGGCELALAADFIYASERAMFGLPEVGLGVIPGFGGSQRLPRRIGVGLARELAFSGALIDAARAHQVGLVNQVVPHDELMSKVREVARLIASKAPLAVAACKRVMARGQDADLASAVALENAAFSALFATDDAREGMLAFIEKRTTSFKAS
jgi:enoyl-CoA hydratase